MLVEISEGDDRQARLQNLETLTLPYEASIISLRRTLSETIIEKEAYPL